MRSNSTRGDRHTVGFSSLFLYTIVVAAWALLLAGSADAMRIAPSAARAAGRPVVNAGGFAILGDVALPVTVRLMRFNPPAEQNAARDPWKKMVEELEGAGSTRPQVFGVMEIDGKKYGLVVDNPLANLREGKIEAHVAEWPEGPDPMAQFLLIHSDLSGSGFGYGLQSSGRLGMSDRKPPTREELFGGTEEDPRTPGSVKQTVGNLKLTRNITPGGSNVLSGTVTVRDETYRLILSLTGSAGAPLQQILPGNIINMPGQQGAPPAQPGLQQWRPGAQPGK